MDEDFIKEQDTRTLDEEMGEDTTSKPSEELLKIREVAENQKIRAEKAEAKLKKLLASVSEEEEPQKEKSETPKTDPNSVLLDRIIRTELRSLGVVDNDDINWVREVATGLNIDPVEAMSKAYVKAELEERKRSRQNASAVPTSKGGSPSKGKTVDWYIKNNEVPEDPETFEKYQEEMQKRSRMGS